MVWWKESFEKINGELELIRKKRETLENLLNSGRISQSTYEYYSKELEEAEKEIENRRNALVEKINSRIENLEKQLQVLEMLFADIEISHAVGELDEETYTRQRDLLATGLDFARRELENLKEFTSNLEAPNMEPIHEQPMGETEETVTEVITEEPIKERIEEAIEEQIPAEPIEPVETPPEEGQPQETEETPVPEPPMENVTFQAVEGENEGTEEPIETQD